MSIQNFIANSLTFLNGVVIPFLLVVGFLFFAFNVVRYFILGSTSDEGRENAKNLAIYSFSGFVIIVIFWGMINLISSSIGFAGTSTPVSDYIDSNAAKQTGIPAGDGPGGPNPGSNLDTTPSASLNEPENLLPPGYENSQDCSGNTLDCYQNEEEEDPGFFGGILRNTGFINDDGEPFWASWDDDDHNSNNSDEDYEVNCLLPNGMIIETRLSYCLDNDGEVYEGELPAQSSASNQNSFELVNCVYTDSYAGRRQMVQTTASECVNNGGVVQ